MIKERPLSPELIRRFIRVEQRVSAHFGKPVNYHQTVYFKSLADTEKRRFEAYLKKENFKSKGKFLLSVVMGLLLIFLIPLNIPITGHAIENSLHINNYLLTGILVAVLIIILVCILISSLDKKNKEKRFNNHLRPLEKALAKPKK